jgi:tRNA uridine 5-carboxymethylaminomethyl modification enzyme
MNVVTLIADLMRTEADIPFDLDEGELSVAAIQIKYEGYLNQQLREIERMKRSALRPIPGGFDYASIPGLSREMVEKLSLVQPRTLDQAGRIPGVTPAAVQLVAVFLELAHRKQYPPQAPAQRERPAAP